MSVALRDNYRPERLASDSIPQISKTLLKSFLLNKKVQRIEVGPKYLNPKIPFDTALRHLLEEITEQAPLILSLDDLHWAEDSFWQILPAICRITEHRPLFLLLSYRPAELAENRKGHSVIREIEAKFLPERMSLRGLNLKDLHQLADRLLVSLSQEKLEMVQQISQGNPYIAKEFLLNSGEATESVDNLLDGRIDALSNEARNQLDVAAVLGNSFSFAIWQECASGKISLQELLAG